MYVIWLLNRYLGKKNVKLKSESSAKATHSTKLDTQIPSSLKSAVNIKSRPTDIAKQ